MAPPPLRPPPPPRVFPRGGGPPPPPRPAAPGGVARGRPPVRRGPAGRRDPGAVRRRVPGRGGDRRRGRLGHQRGAGGQPLAADRGGHAPRRFRSRGVLPRTLRPLHHPDRVAGTPPRPPPLPATPEPPAGAPGRLQPPPPP